MIHSWLSAQGNTNSPVIWKNILHNAASGLTPVTGSWIQNEIVFGITWLQLILAAVVIVGTLVLAAILRWILRHRIEQEKHAAQASQKAKTSAQTENEQGWHLWLKLTLEAAIPPLMLFVWSWGIYAAFRLLFVQMETGAEPSVVLKVLHWCRKTANFIALFWFLFRLVRVVEMEMQRWALKSERKWDDVLAVLIGRALRMIVPLMGVILIVPTLNIPDSYHDFIREATSVLLIAAIGFILYQLASTTEKAVVEQYRVDVKDNLETRKIQTQVRMLKRIAVTLIFIFTAASMLMVFDSVRRLGASLLASAGVAGIIIGFAAQRSIGTIFAGVQLAFTQPIRIDDVVIVEGEWGRVEEVTMTYVVVKIWDLRRLIVPITYFIEKPFQNWTRTSADILGSVMLYTDYSVPLKPLREELDRILENSKLWDKKVKVLQVTDSKEHTLELRVLVSAGDAGSAWDLRCEVRERLVDFLQRNYPQSLPRWRIEEYPHPQRAREKVVSKADNQSAPHERAANLLEKPQ